KHGKFIAINCGAIPEGTIDSELFGHKKGAFTGASEERKGYFEEADGGTVFLDEVGELPLGTQARLLRVLEYGEFIKVGASKVQKTQLRIVAATNVDLLAAVHRRKFREDLYYRLNTVPLRIPPLRERGKDIAVLFRKFATDFADKYHVTPLQLVGEATEALLKYRFPGNIRQLKNLVEQISALEIDRNIAKEVLLNYLPPEQEGSLALYQGQQNQESFQERELLYKVLFDMKRDMHELKHLVLELLNTDTQHDRLIKKHASLFRSVESTENLTAVPLQVVSSNTPATASEPTESAALSIETQEKKLIAKALERYQHRRKLAAGALGISERTLYRKIKQYDLDQTV
ncbi:MAG: sigma 54-interacting transcriptional regulator, partial [Bacteroidota bacterium]